MAKKWIQGAIKHPGSETKRAEKNGRSLHEQAEVDAKSPNKRIRGKGQFALNAKKWHHGKRRRSKPMRARTRRKRTARKK